MLTGRLLSLALLTAVLIGSAGGRGPLTLATTGRVKVRPGAELTLDCGDRQHAGVVQYWHTPFGDLQSPGVHGYLDPVAMQHDGSLVIANASRLHSGLYYCLLQGTEGTTLWPYRIHTGHLSGPSNKTHQDSGYLKYLLESSSRAKPLPQQADRLLDLHDATHRQDSGVLRLRRDAGPGPGPGSGGEAGEVGEAGVSPGVFAGAVAGSVVVTFLVGFSAGALSRTHVLRCFGAVTTRVRSLRQRRRQTNAMDHGCEVTMATLPPMYENKAFQKEQASDDDGDPGVTMEITMSTPTPSPPPAKPQRSFRQKREEQPETAAYLERCDHAGEEERGREERGREERGESRQEEEERQKGEVEEERESSSGSLSAEDRGSETRRSEDGEEKEGRRDRREEEEGWREEERAERAGEEMMREDTEEKEGRRGSREEEEEAGKAGEEKGSEEERGGSSASEDDDGVSDQSSTDTEEEEGGSRTQEEGMKNSSGGETVRSPPPPPRPAPRSRVIRLYQYDEEGQRYSHLPEPAPEELGPAPRLKQRSLSLTRLNAIMAAASAGPMDSPNNKETGREERGEGGEGDPPASPPFFHMEI